MATARFFPTRIDIPQERRQRLVELLNQQLADVFDLRSQVKYAHWNVKGEEFISLHKLFDELATELDGHTDEIAERATALGGTAYGTVRQSASRSRVPEYPTDVIGSLDHVRALVERYAVVANGVRKAIDDADGLGDKDTADLFTEISRGLDKNLWFLEAHLQGEK
jgi:starvation-inducible DNA-binding protein